MTRVRSLEGREAGIVAGLIQFLLKLNVGKNINPVKVQAHSTRSMVANFLANAVMGSGKTKVGNDLRELVKIRAATRNGCPF
jgi:alkylhydroperoxidase family enzyme